MRYLVDTHTLLWFIHGHDSLSPLARIVIEEPDNECFVSVASLWEMAIKVAIHKLNLGLPFKDLKQKLEESNLKCLPISFEHTLAVSTLPLHHTDPFDRLLIVQSQVDELILISKDEHFKFYNIETLW